MVPSVSELIQYLPSNRRKRILSQITVQPSTTSTDKRAIIASLKFWVSYLYKYRNH